MPCDPSDNTLNVPGVAPIPIPGFGIPYAPLTIPLPDWDLPTDIIEDILDLLRQLGALFPSGLFKPFPDSWMRTILDGISKLLSMIAPFLSFYNFIMAALRLIVCIIEVLCAIPNPVAVAIKLQVLFSQCLPPFLNLFPWLALIAMIIALLLLILALILFIIETIIAIIEEIIKNIIALGKAIGEQDEASILAIAQKLAALFCFIDNIMAIFIALAALMAIIQALAALAGFSICSDEDVSGCCNDALCPPFIKNTELDGMPGTQGRLTYHKQIGSDISILLPGIPDGAISLPPLRPERWQFVNDDTSPPYEFKAVITPVIPPLPAALFYYPKIFWPSGLSFDAESGKNVIPYFVDMRIFVNPTEFGHVDPIGTERYMRINDCYVIRQPYIGEYDYQNILRGPFPFLDPNVNMDGTFSLQGGLVFEDDGETPFEIDGEQATLNDFIHYDEFLWKDSLANLPGGDDGYVFEDVEFSWKMNHEGLVYHNLITVGCFPGVSVEKATQNAKLAAEGIEAVDVKMKEIPDGETLPSIGVFPNVGGCQECVHNALEELRKDVRLETVAEFQTQAEACLNDLADQVLFAYCNTLIAGVSQFNSTAEIEPDAQFTTATIAVKVVLYDGGGTIISNNIPEQCVPEVEALLKGTATFGEITDFVYDGSQAFFAYISSDASGAGELQVSFDGKVFSTIIEGTDLDNPSSIEESVWPYTFVGAVDQPAIRRDETDVANDGE